jgi:hypothetical protein
MLMAIHPFYVKGAWVWSILFRGAKTLFYDASTCISINRCIFEEIGLFHSIHQHYPLVPTLYYIVAKALGYPLAHRVSQGLIKGIGLPKLNSTQHVNGHFSYFSPSSRIQR